MRFLFSPLFFLFSSLSLHDNHFLFSYCLNQKPNNNGTGEIMEE